MRPRMTRQPPEPEPEPDESLQNAELERSRAGLQEVLDTMERFDGFSKDHPDSIMCKQCGMPCYDDDNTPYRRAFPAAGGGVVCTECFLG